jgi:hypothetical protein
MTEKTTPKRRRDALVTLVGPAEHRDYVYLNEGVQIRFFEGRARVPESVAKKLLRPGWHVRP